MRFDSEFQQFGCDDPWVGKHWLLLLLQQWQGVNRRAFRSWQYRYCLMNATGSNPGAPDVVAGSDHVARDGRHARSNVPMQSYLVYMCGPPHCAGLRNADGIVRRRLAGLGGLRPTTYLLASGRLLPAPAADGWRLPFAAKVSPVSARGNRHPEPVHHGCKLLLQRKEGLRERQVGRRVTFTLTRSSTRSTRRSPARKKQPIPMMNRLEVTITTR